MFANILSLIPSVYTLSSSLINQYQMRFGFLDRNITNFRDIYYQFISKTHLVALSAIICLINIFILHKMCLYIPLYVPRIKNLNSTYLIIAIL